MFPGKKRLYLAVYSLGGEVLVEEPYRRGHYQFRYRFIIGPKEEEGSDDEVAGRRYSLEKGGRRGWRFKSMELDDVRNDDNLLCRILIGKISSESLIARTMRKVKPARMMFSRDDEYNICATWASDVAHELKGEHWVVGTAETNFGEISRHVQQYVADKVAAGRYRDTEDQTKPVPTWDMLQGKEIIP
ncbi:hypothetical protein HJFPF1_05089 [Paramyrothecium foliicola]|nr:hypothetical protein HJFPF1_05089 [Paramyrothecium foliicola]